MEVDIAQRLASYLREGGVYGALALIILVSIVTIRHLYKELRKAEAEKFDLAIRVAPLASKMLEMIEKSVLAKARRGGGGGGSTGAFPSTPTPPPLPRNPTPSSLRDTLPTDGKTGT